MYWLNIDSLLQSKDEPDSHISSLFRKPSQRWGQACVSAHNKLYIVGGYEGQYLGDVWTFDFQTLSFTEMMLDGTDKDSLSRSNHTAVFYEKHNSIYIFAGGQAQKQRFNDTLRLELETQNPNKRATNKIKVSKVKYMNETQIPSARTYHASCLVKNQMITIGGESTSDLRDFWALDLDQAVWHKPDVQNFDSFTPKRFHSLTAVSDEKIITFGGCYGEYIHLNEMHIFDISEFMKDPSNINSQVYCTKVNITENVPSTRWGHSASSYQEKLYIVGGRNEHDIIDTHEFDLQKQKWQPIQINGALPKPRRRHSCVFVSGSLILFGGFDGCFYNDLNILDFSKPEKQIITIQESTIDQDYQSLVNNSDGADITFIMDNEAKTKIYAHKSLLLFRPIEKELNCFNFDEQNVEELFESPQVPDFLKAIYYCRNKAEIFLPGIHCKYSFIKLLEYLYCNKFIENVTPQQILLVSQTAFKLGLQNIQINLIKKVNIARDIIQKKLIFELEQKKSQQSQQEPLQLTSSQKSELNKKAEKLESQAEFDFCELTDQVAQSPEDKKYENQQKQATSLMNQCRNLDEFYDIIFQIDDTLIKSNSLVLKARCPYFKSMLSNQYSFKESLIKNTGYIKVSGVPRSYFTNIIQYIYSDHFYIQKQEAEFYIKLLIYADYFMLPRLIDICSSYLKPFITVKTVIQILLIAHAHNADQLEKYCINFISHNEQEIKESRCWRHLKRQAQESLIQNLLNKLRQEKEESFVSIAIANYQNKQLKVQSQPILETIKTRIRSQFSFKEKSNSQLIQQLKEDELDIDELLNTPNYIYLEDHFKCESYNHEKFAVSMNPTSVNSQISNNIEEEKENRNYANFKKSNTQNLRNRQNKENQNPNGSFSQLNQVNQKPISGTNQANLQLFKKRDSKRMPLQSIDNELLEKGQINSNLISKRSKDEQ